MRRKTWLAEELYRSPTQFKFRFNQRMRHSELTWRNFLRLKPVIPFCLTERCGKYSSFEDCIESKQDGLAETIQT